MEIAAAIAAVIGLVLYLLKRRDQRKADPVEKAKAFDEGVEADIASGDSARNTAAGVSELDELERLERLSK